MTEDDVRMIVAALVPRLEKRLERRCEGLIGHAFERYRAEAEVITARAVGPFGERVVALETRPPQPGPAGQDGAPGPPGKDGADGKPGLEYRGVFVEGQTYERGDLVTWGGSAWHCNETTTIRPGDGAKAWTLMVKRGRDSKP